jgi:hypothetical protein
VAERVTAYEPRSGQTLEVEDERLHGTQTVAFEPEGEQVRVSLTLEYRLKSANPIVDLLFIRRALRDSLQRTVNRFGHERHAEVTRS